MGSLCCHPHPSCPAASKRERALGTPQTPRSLSWQHCTFKNKAMMKLINQTKCCLPCALCFAVITTRTFAPPSRPDREAAPMAVTDRRQAPFSNCVSPDAILSAPARTSVGACKTEKNNPSPSSHRNGRRGRVLTRRLVRVQYTTIAIWQQN